jgi:hypothetical protein
VFLAVPTVLSTAYFVLEVWRFVNDGKIVITRSPSGLLSLLIITLEHQNRITCL